MQARTPFIDLAAQRASLGNILSEACLAALARGDYVLGEDVDRFEEEFAAYCGVRHAIGVDSGTSALELALRAHDIGPGDEVITVANTFVATAFAISHCGATPILVDADPVSYNIDCAQLRLVIGPSTRAIVPVHLYGRPADMTAIQAVAHEHDLVVIEDACQAHGARWHGRRTGSFGDAAAFSFYPSKNLGAHGDGGIIVTGDDGIAERLRLLRNYGAPHKYRSELVGYNRRLDTLQAAMLRVKLPLLDGWNDARRRHAARYTELLDGTGLGLPISGEDIEHVWHLYVVQAHDRDGLRARLRDQGVDTGIHYPVPIHRHPAYRALGYSRGDFPVAERLAGQVLSLPMYPELDDHAVERVASVLRDCLRAAPRRVRGGLRLRSG